MRPSFFHHLHPPTIPAAQARWRHTLGAGGTAIFLMLILGVTGILEMFYYSPIRRKPRSRCRPSPIMCPLAGLIRNLHYWAAQAVDCGFGDSFSAGYFHRRLRTVRADSTICLDWRCSSSRILLDFTGYILRWDVDICYPLVTGTNLLKTIPLIGDFLYRIAVGGGEACATALLRFYTWHIFGLTILVVILGFWHAFRVRRDGGIAVPPPQLRDRC